jgi:hypothetical protein
MTTPHPAFGHLLPASAGRRVITQEYRHYPLAPRSGERVAEGRVRGSLAYRAPFLTALS